MSTKFAFYEVVSVLPCEVVPERLWGTRGVVVGRTDLGGTGSEYGIQLFSDEGHCWQLPERYLRSEGKIMERQEIYDGSRLIVVVDPLTGAGEKKE
jgi:hypothetical protein